MKKLDFIVYLRCLAVLLVVFGHVLCVYSDSWAVHTPKIDNEFWSQLKRLIYMVHLPVFTMISGYLYFYIRKRGGYDSFKLFVIKKTKRLIIPLLVWSIIECIIDFNCDISVIPTAPLHLWYLRFLFVCFAITWVYDKWIIRRPWLLLPIIIGVELVHSFKPDFCPQFMGYYSWFLIGMALQEICTRINLKRNMVYAILGLSLIVCVFSFVIFGKAGYSAMLFNSSLFLAFSVSKFPPIPICIESIDKCSMGIYLIHHPIVWNIVSTSWGRYYMALYPYVAPFVLFVFSFAISWLISSLLLKTKYLRFIIG